MAMRVLREQADAQLAVPALLQELESILLKMHTTAASLRLQLERCDESLGGRRASDSRLFPSGWSSSSLLECLEAFAAAYARELELRRVLAHEICQGRGGGDLNTWEESARLSLSAWVLQARVLDGAN